MKNITLDKIAVTLLILLLTFIVVETIILFANYYIINTYGKMCDYNLATGTVYYDRGDYTEVRYKDGLSVTLGNEKTEYENNEIGE